ncbi:T9SS type A sorting domain-containing protein [Kriegella sp. EG-1]|nr:T9SS type A sorting domain-containing protein [Flavobacteriaceae bacterium EG-1]
MKNFILSFFLIFSSNYFFGQCPTMEIIINNQQDIDSFAANYPNCTELTNNLVLQGAGITNLNGLSQITEISGNLVIGGFNVGTSLTNLIGLDNLETITGKLDINRNANLETLTGLSKLTVVGSTQIGSGISISLNPSLLNLNGLNSLNRVNNSFNILNNTSLLNIEALSNLTTLLLGNFLSLTIQGNNALASLNGLEGLTTINGGLVISGNSLVNLTGLENLITITQRLTITNCDSLLNFQGLNSLQSIGAEFQLETNSSLVNFQGLEALNSIAGNFRIAHNSELLNFNGYQNLSLINGDFTVFNNEKLDDFTGLGNLVTINGNVEIRSNQLLQDFSGLSSLSTISQELQIRDNPSLQNLIGLESLESIGLDLQININPSLLNLNGLDNLKTVSRHLEISQNATLTEIKALKNLETISGDLSVNQNPLLLNLLGLEKITEIGRHMYIGFNTSLINLNGLDNLESILSSSNINNNTKLKSLDGLSSLKSVNAFEFELLNNTELTNINALENLSQIKGDLILQNNDSLVDFSGLESLNYIEGTLSIKDNEKLESLSGIQNIDNESIANLVIENNPALAICEALSICNYLGGSSPRNILDNKFGCDTEIEILNRCDGALNLITGQILYDQIDDGCDPTDFPVKNRVVEATNGTKVFSSVTDSTGVFNIYVSEGSYTTRSFLNEEIFNVSPPYNYSTYENLVAKDTVDFCITKLIEANDVQLTILPITESRPGFNTSYIINFDNKGTETISGDITMQYDDSKLTFLEASETTSSQTQNSISFNYLDLKPFESRTIRVNFNILAPPTANIDDIIEFTGTINPINNDYLPEDNIFHLEQTLIGSYDPNDIVVVEGDSISIENKDNYLNYIIRFQNTGTASAINVRIAHDLDSNLDWSTFTFTSSSHSNRTSITNGNEIVFAFDDINLPDSNSNEPESHGYIAFKIKPKSDIQLGDIISGIAEIYFDFNPAIITNTVTTEIVQKSDLPLQIQLSSYSNINCSGENNGIIQVNAIGGIQPYSFELFDNNNILINSSTSAIFTDLPPGQYSVLVTDTNLRQEQSSIVSITEPEILTATFTVKDVSCFNNNDGQANFNASGGTAPYEFSIDSGTTFQTGATFQNLATGTYSGVIRDANDCQVEVIFKISSGSEINDCNAFSLPSNNFKILVTSETCSSSNNGSILITAVENLNYSVTLDYGSNTINKTFSTFTSFENLEAGNYDICITVTSEVDYKRCFSVQISEPEKLIVETDLDPSGKLVTLKMKGGNKYNININGKKYSTTENNITVPISSENNSITVSTDSECQGMHTERIISTNNKILVYPNPVEKGDVSIHLPNTTENEMLLTMFSPSGQRVLEKMEKSENGFIKLNIDRIPAGIFTLIITTESSNETVKIIKK